jgi:hypothetical protein
MENRPRGTPRLEGHDRLAEDRASHAGELRHAACDRRGLAAAATSPLRRDNRLQYDIAGTLGNGAWGYIGGTYDTDASPNNHRLYLNGTCVRR